MAVSSQTPGQQDVVTLRDYTDVRLAALEKAVNERFVAIEKATAFAYETQQARLASMNEFRAQLKTQNETFVTHSEVEACLAPILADIRILREARATLEGKASQQSVNVAYVFSFIAAALAIIDMLVMYL